MNVLFVDLETAWRGGQNQALLTLKGLRHRGHVAELVASRGSALGHRAAPEGIPVHRVSRKLFRYAAVHKIRSLLKQGRFDVIHVNEAHALTAAWLARAHKFAPMIISRRVGFPLRQSKVGLARFRAASRIIAISDWVKDQAVASGAPRDKMAIVYEGEPVPDMFSAEAKRAARQRWRLPEDAHVLGCVAVLSEDKGHEYLIRALPKLRAEFPNVRLLLAGDGPLRSRLSALSRQLGVWDAVLFAGFVKDIASVYATLDVFLFPAQFEGLGTSLLAAMARGIPSAAFRCCAFPEIIDDGSSGFLMERNAAAIEEVTARLLRDPALAGQIGAAGRRTIEERFSADRMVEETLKVYADCLGEK